MCVCVHAVCAQSNSSVLVENDLPPPSPLANLVAPTLTVSVLVTDDGRRVEGDDELTLLPAFWMPLLEILTPRL